MTTPTHLALGGIIGFATSQPFLALAISGALDLDHLDIYLRNKVFSSPSKFWQTITNNEDPYGGQRGYLHSVFGLSGIALISWFFAPTHLITITTAHLGHIILDAVDSADWWPFYPFKKLNFRGPIGFFTKDELPIAIFLVIVNLVLWL